MVFQKLVLVLGIFIPLPVYATGFGRDEIIIMGLMFIILPVILCNIFIIFLLTLVQDGKNKGIIKVQKLFTVITVGLYIVFTLYLFPPLSIKSISLHALSTMLLAFTIYVVYKLDKKINHDDSEQNSPS